MSDRQLTDALRLYDVAARSRIVRVRVQHRGFSVYAKSLSGLYASQNECRHDNNWRELFHWLYTAWENFASSPLPFAHPAHLDNLAMDRIEVLRTSLDIMYPDSSQTMGKAVQALTELRSCQTNPIGDKIAELTDSVPNVGIIVNRHALIEPIQRWLGESLAEPTGPRVLSPSELRSNNYLDRVVCIGPAIRYPDWMVSAPRTPETYVVLFSALNDSFSSEPKLPKGSDWRASRLPEIEDETESAAEEVEEASLNQSYQLNLTPKPEEDDVSDPDFKDETVLARMFALHGDSCIWLNRSGRITVIDMNEEEVLEVGVNSVTPGMFILNRPGRGGDYIAQVADQLLGDEALALRTLQREWKSKLKEISRHYGLFETSLKLIDLGSLRANEQNVRNWGSFDSIRTRDRTDFDAIMKLIGWESRSYNVWNNMATIDGAHRRAGRFITRKLHEDIRQSDLNALEINGEMTFSISGDAQTSLSALRVEQVLGDRDVPAWAVSRRFKATEADWRE